MKVTKGQPKQEAKKVIAFYTGNDLVFRARHSALNYVLYDEAVYQGYSKFEDYLELMKTREGFIAFYEGDTIVIEL